MSPVQKSVRVEDPQTSQTRRSRSYSMADIRAIDNLPDNSRLPKGAKLPCVRCFFRMQKHFYHRCESQVPGPRRTACLFCKRQKKGCKPFHPRYHRPVSEATQLGTENRGPAIGIIRRNYESSDGKLDQAQWMAHASAVQLQQSLENEAARRQLEQPADNQFDTNDQISSDANTYIHEQYSAEQGNQQPGSELECEPSSELEKQETNMLVRSYRRLSNFIGGCNIS